jgi:hypothetical protein
MKVKMIHSLVKIAITGVLAAFLLILAGNADAQCGGTFQALASNFASVQSNPKSALRLAPISKTEINPFWADDRDDDNGSAIVGLWRVEFDITVPGVPDPIDIQDAFQIWNAGGTEAHNARVDPRTSNICLGAWREDRGMYRLTHRVWNWSTNGDFLGTINLTEAVRVINRGKNQTGIFTLDFFDPDGNPLATAEHPAHVEGTVVGTRIPAN